MIPIAFEKLLRTLTFDFTQKQQAVLRYESFIRAIHEDRDADDSDRETAAVYEREVLPELRQDCRELEQAIELLSRFHQRPQQGPAKTDRPIEEDTLP